MEHKEIIDKILNLIVEIDKDETYIDVYDPVKKEIVKMSKFNIDPSYLISKIKLMFNHFDK